MKQEELIYQCIKKNRKAQSELFKKYKDTLYLISLKYCRNKTDAEDNLHDSFITIFKSINKFKHKGSFEGWLKRITINKAIDRYRKKNSFYEINDEITSSPEFNDEYNDEKPDITLDELLFEIQNLPDQYRIVFNLYLLDGYKHREIADLLSISESTSKSNFLRAKAILRKKIKQKLCETKKENPNAS